MSTVVRWNPFREMAAMQSAIDRIFDETWRTGWPVTNGTTSGFFMAVDVHETADAYQVFASLPGVTADQINISINDGVLSLSVEVPQPEIPEGTRVLMQERGFGKFSRSICLARAVDNEHVEATFEDGVLSLHLPVAPEAQPRQIPIKTGNRSLAAQN
jgi:HSP20 family protein